MSVNEFPPPPPDREAILEIIGSQRAQIYHTVRQILDDLEQAARWEDLYYPPAEVDDFLRIHRGLLGLIAEIPYRISALCGEVLEQSAQSMLRGLPDHVLDPAHRQMVLNLLEADGAAAATASMRKTAVEAVARIPADEIPGPLKLLLEWLIDRFATAPSVDLDGETYEQALESIPEDVLDSSMKQILGNIQFYFDGIQMMAAGDIEKLEARIAHYESADPAELTGEERVFTCEIAADLKGKCTSAVMGAAANLIAEGRWNGAELEPMLFPEKAAEIERNEQLVKTLQEVLESIRRLPEEVPLVEIAEQWKAGCRVDRYALTHLYGFLGNLGKLMKESSRRALYSGDYHQVQLRESRLSGSVNELNMLHNRTWEVLQEGDPEIAGLYPQMVDKAAEIAAVVDGELLKKMIGEKQVQLLLQIVSIEGERRKETDVRLGRDQEADYRTEASIALREQLPESLRSLARLLYDEDLQTFLELLLGSVLKRASLAMDRRDEAAAEAEPVAEAVEVPGPEAPPEEALDVLEVEELAIPDLEPAELPAAALAAKGDTARKREELEELRRLLRDLLASTHPHRKAFNLVHRLLAQKGMVPPAMLQSILPFLETLTDTLVPQLVTVSAQGAIPITYQGELTQYCRDLARRDLTPRDMKLDVMNNMDGLLRLLGDLEAETNALIDTFATDGAAVVPSLDGPLSFD